MYFLLEFLHATLSISRMISIFHNLSLNTVSQSNEEGIGAFKPRTSFSVHATLGLVRRGRHVSAVTRPVRVDEVTRVRQ